LVHIHHFQTVSKTILEYFKLKNLPILVSFRGSDLITRSQNKDFYKKIKYASHIHTISRYMKFLFEDKSIDIPISVIYRSINKISSKAKAQQVFNNPTRIISVGRLVWIKGHFYLLDALYNLKKQGFNFSLDIYGEGDLRSFYEFRIKQLGLEANVFLKGFIDNNLLKKEYETYDLAIQPSFFEALSNGLLDLISHNIPCVISNQGGMMELIEPGVNGEIFDINQPSTLEKAILRCLNLDKNIVANFNSSFLEDFSSEVELDKFEKLYNSLIK
jgi:glycosyltransferase involved in cell wall biosynthesis